MHLHSHVTKRYTKRAREGHLTVTRTGEAPRARPSVILMVRSLFALASYSHLTRRRLGVLFALTAGWLYGACSLDERTLTLAPAEGGHGNHGGSASREPTGEAGTPAGRAGAEQGGQAGQAGDSEGGQAGQAYGGSATFDDGCTDLDHDGKSDCSETLLMNSSFATDVGGWQPEIGATISWDPLDLMGTAGSGSALVTSSGAIDAPGVSLVAAAQCIAVQAGQVLEIFAQARTESGPVDGNATISLWFFPSAGCGESPSAVYQTDPIATGQTVLVQGSKIVPDSMVSMRVRLGVSKPFKAESFSVRFDNLLIDAH